MNRRELIVAGAAAIAFARNRGWARQPADGALHALLDGIGADKDPAESLHRLAAFDAASLSPSVRADLDTVRWGLALDARIARAKRESSTGKVDYALLFERQFGAPITPRDLHRRFETMAAALTRRADSLLRAEGLSRGSVGERLRGFARQPRWLYADNDTGRAQAVADMARTLAKAKERLPALIAPLPVEASGVIVRNLSAADIAAGRGGYRQPPENGQPGAYHVDLREIRKRPRWSLPSVVHHELLPGHFAQQALQSEASPHTLRLGYSPSFAEGWAVYAEQLAEEAGLLRGDRPATLGYLQWMLFRIGRATIDTGVHVMGWSVSQATEFAMALQGDAMIFAPYGQDIERIRQNPGGRAAEAMTWLAIVEQRGALVGNRRGLRLVEFHHSMLRNGAMPFGLLAERLGGPSPTAGATP
jgi:uncharacterized protein (DUF885 family)